MKAESRGGGGHGTMPPFKYAPGYRHIYNETLPNLLMYWVIIYILKSFGLSQIVICSLSAVLYAIS